ncbi:helix-turn-helix domain-containing protein [Fulvivirga lutea]|uniref:Helix-turn-helix domain-containing protein n=1 Tax=Fulvivirga lutea TaxID=2810512 RepID=A0A975A1C3_9BACT|nr:helix-turn-helix domain-containing protein [Fulvivirga lutea]QSE97377.1 helix-turn-helix domain-containing protein [Fulvivirga lutea]
MKIRRPFLGIALAAISLLILVYMYEHYGWFYDYPQFIWAFPPVWYVIGPAFYLFIKRHIGRRLERIDWFHLFPFVVFYIYLFPFYLRPAQERIHTFINFWEPEVYTIDPHHYLYQLHFLFYAMLSLRILRSGQKELKEFSSDSNIINYEYIGKVIQLMLIFCFVGLIYYLLVDLKVIVPGWNYSPIIYITLSMLIHLTTYYSWSEKPIEGTDTIEKYISSGLTDARMSEIVDQVVLHIAKESVYKNADLRLKDVSNELRIPSHHISQSINHKLNQSFFDLVNTHRVEALKANIGKEEYKHLTLVAVAEEFGFKSSSSFFRIFKKIAGLTPKEYLKSINE